jgi:hypothetical protein
LRLTDFGIARVALKTLRGSGAGTVGYIAPEQAMGKPSFRSDVFSLGLILYRMLSGALPEWPYHWPPAGYNRLRSRAHPDLIALIRKSIELEARRRFRDAGQMESAFARIRSPLRKRPVEKSATRKTRPETTTPDWQAVRRREFQRHYGKCLQTHASCPACGGPISEAMHGCPWCGKKFPHLPAETSFPTRCPRCRRGLKLDWLYCPWCYGPGFEPDSQRQYTDRRYTARCSNPHCSRRQLMPFMQYCPWCHRRVRRKWRIEGSKDTCSRCGWGVLRLYWSYCPWCARRLES